MSIKEKLNLRKFALNIQAFVRCVSIFLATLLALPAQSQTNERIALVIGNSAYRTAPLPNPKNDAEAMSELLTKAGFKVDMQMDTDLIKLQAAVQRFGTAVRNPKVKFGLFYYAGHGLQQDWRNYLVPVNANIKSTAEIPKQTVDISSLLTYMEHAQGRSFLVILDACRDNPFAANYKPTAKGLSQFDAPVGSLLAYATAPGNVAQDGDGKNGLYTSYLLREFAVPGARLEDAFKRVRLSVRLASKGQQIPWESTSLEEDLFLFPSATQVLSAAEKEKLFERELASWQEVKSAADPEVLVRFIREYPSGSASELAQAKLNRILLAKAEREAQERKSTDQAKAAAAALEVAAREELARRKVAEAEQKRLQALRVEEERQRVALVQAQKEEATRAKAEQLALEQQALARAAADKSRLAQEEAARLAKLKQEREAQQAQQVAQAQAEQARQVQAKAASAQADFELSQALRRQQLALAQTKAREAEAARLASLEQAEKDQVELLRLTQERQALQLAAAPITLESTPLQLLATPYYKGFAQHERSFRVGDEYQFVVTDLFNKSTRNVLRRVTQIDVAGDRITYDGGTYVTDLMGNTLVNQLGTNNSVRQFYPAELFVGKKWTTKFNQDRPNGARYTFDYKLKVVGKETITVPAGTFEAFRIEARGFNVELGAYIERDIWVAPGVNADIAQNYRVKLRSGALETNQREELLAYSAGSITRTK